MFLTVIFLVIKHCQVTRVAYTTGCGRSNNARQIELNPSDQAETAKAG